MSATNIMPFLCDAIDKASIRSEWEKWYRAFSLYLDSEDITDPKKKKSKLLHLGGTQLQEVIYNIPGALVEGSEVINAYEVLVNKLNEYFSPKRNSTFERHLFRSLKPDDGENLSKFMLRLRNQAAKCQFGQTKDDVVDINLKDKLIDAWAPTELKKRLLEKEHSLTEILNICQVYEQINEQSNGMATTHSTADMVCKISTKRDVEKSDVECGRCGQKSHSANSAVCPARNAKCNKCNYSGHFARMCRTRADKRKLDDFGKGAKRRKMGFSNIRHVSVEQEQETGSDEEKLKCFDCFKITGEDTLMDSMDEFIDCFIGGHKISMIIDSGSRYNLLSEVDYSKLCKSGAIMWNTRYECEKVFRAYAGKDLLRVKTVFEAVIGINLTSNLISSFYVIENGRQSLLGKETAVKLKVLKVGIDVYRVSPIKPFPKIKGIKVSLTIDKTVKPVQQPLRRIPAALEEKLQTKLEQAQAEDIIEPVVGPSPWVSPVVLVFKENGDLRLCIDMRRANKAILRENYPLPTFDTFMTRLVGAKYFSRLDLKNAYHQLELDESSREITAFITPKGIFRYKRLLFGVNSAPEIFQKVMANILSPCKKVLNYLDDIIVFGQDEGEHDKNLEEVFEIFKRYDIQMNEEKSVFKVKKLKFLGHVLSTTGIDPDPAKIVSVLNFRAPCNKEETRSFLGLVNYLGKFIPDLGDVTEPLRSLTKKEVKFSWGPAQDNSFERLKKSLANLPTLSFFDPKKRTQVIADASPIALGAVLLQFADNVPRVISFASKSLTEVERRYSQTEKESLALVWSVERFYYYLAGIEFELVTDHKPLEAIFKPISRPPARIERWVLRLQSFKFKVIYRAGKFNIADSFSRLCTNNNTNSNTFDKHCEHNILAIIEKTVPRALTILEIVNNNDSDPELLEAVHNVKTGEWNAANKNKFFPFRQELCTLGNILLRGTKIVIPAALRTRVLELAHEGHPGETVMKRRVRSKLWWPLVDRDVEKFVKSCRNCLLVSRPNKPAPMTRRVLPDGPWQSIAMDLLGPLPDHEYIFVVIDYFSRYHELSFLKKITSNHIIAILDEMFSRLGYPKVITADNGRQFVSDEFQKYCVENAIELLTSPPYWPQANGEVENMNKSILKRIQIANAQGTNYKTEIRKFILMYNVTPHGTTGKSPSELMFKRRIRDKIPSQEDIDEDTLNLEARDCDIINKEKGKIRGDKARRAKMSDIDIGDKVLLRNVIFPNKLTTTFNPQEFEVIERKGNDVLIRGNGKVFRRNVSHVKKIPELNLDSTIDSEGVPSSPTPTEAEYEEAQESNPRLLLKLKNIGGMWQPAIDNIGDDKSPMSGNPGVK